MEKRKVDYNEYMVKYVNDDRARSDYWRIHKSFSDKMLFRPHRPIYFGKFQVPFTPGLIPKRRDELAVQLGKMVVEHLLTPEGIGKS